MSDAGTTRKPRSAAPARASVADLSPSYFSLVMATGIVSIAAHEHGLEIVALVLFWFNALAWVLLWCLNALRMLRYPERFFGDLVDHLRGPGFFTSVAATAVLAAQFVILAGNDRVAMLLGAIALLLGSGLTYAIFSAFIVKSVKPKLDHGIGGGWLLAVVATQSLAVLGALLAAHAHPPWREGLNFFALSMWLWGGMFYIWMVSLIFYRDTFFHFVPDDLTPTYWINMGAMAISTLAGALLVLNAPGAPLLQSLEPFLKGFMVFYWATGTWWIPMLVVLDIWRYVVKRSPIRYDPLYWGAVFPNGMYAVCTYEMAHALSLGCLDFLSIVFLCVSLLAWTAAFAGLLYHLVRLIRGAKLRR
ncbi:MAG: tellurite resistance/C4-dicarboxylate transporter family protein [Burkholderiales bacterium]|nr:tellurite resistance/C4-dicarboxylate transporter family protein [Burkholderiales bacterium]